MLAYRWFPLLLVVVAGCASDNGAGPDNTCELGQTRGCLCDEGEPGTQSCVFEEPAGWSYCACNSAPVAVLDGDYSVPYQNNVKLDGSMSYDPDGSFLEYHWELVDVPGGSAAELDDDTAARPSFYADRQGDYVVRLIVGDGTKWSAPATVTITGVRAANAAPIADAGQNASATNGQPVMLNGSASSDPDGDPISYAWTITARPAGSTTALGNATSVTPTFTPDVDGTYEITLVVSDGALTSQPDRVLVTTLGAANQPPVADAGASATATTGQPVVLNGSASSDPDGDPLAYSWSITMRPTGSTAMLANPTSVSPTFTPDLAGSYTISLVVNDGMLNSAPDTIMISTEGGSLVALPYRPIDAEYSKALDRIIMVAASPNTVQIYNPVTKTSVAVALPTTPTAVSVSPNGLQAAVGHDGWVSIVNLQTATVMVTHPVTTKALDVVLAGNGYVYVFPVQDQWEQIRCIQITTGAETLNTGGLIYAGTKAKLHPDGMSIYGADNGLSPSDIEKYTIGSGTAVSVYDSPYHGDYAMCGDLWMSEDGLRIITRCGNVFRASNVQAQDMTYNGSLAGIPYIRHAVHSMLADKILAIPGTYFSGTGHEDEVVRIYSYGFLNFDQQVALPKFTVLSTQYASHGRFVFVNAAGTEAYVVVQADPTSALLNDYAVVNLAL